MPTHSRGGTLALILAGVLQIADAGVRRYSDAVSLPILARRPDAKRNALISRERWLKTEGDCSADAEEGTARREMPGAAQRCVQSGGVTSPFVASSATTRRTSLGRKGFSITGRPLSETNSRNAEVRVSPVTKTTRSARPGHRRSISS